MQSRRFLKSVGVLCLGVLFFAHTALALSGCAGGGRAPAEAVAATGTMPCCPDSESSSGNRQSNANLCVAHCTADAQNVDSNGHAKPASFVLWGHTASIVPAPGLFALSRPVATPGAIAAPPRTILFKNFRI